MKECKSLCRPSDDSPADYDPQSKTETKLLQQANLNHKELNKHSNVFIFVLKYINVCFLH